MFKYTTVCLNIYNNFVLMVTKTEQQGKDDWFLSLFYINCNGKPVVCCISKAKGSGSKVCRVKTKVHLRDCVVFPQIGDLWIKSYLFRYVFMSWSNINLTLHHSSFLNYFILHHLLSYPPLKCLQPLNIYKDNLAICHL